MMIEKMVAECDFTGNKFDTPVPGFYIFARGATGRVCHVLTVSKEAVPSGWESGVTTLEGVREWAESVEGGYLDY